MRGYFSLLLLTVLIHFLPALAFSDELAHPVTATQVVDLTHSLNKDIPVWPGGVPFQMTRLVDYEKGYRLHKFMMGENTGTHVDAPAHFVKGNESIDQIALNKLVVPAVVLNIQKAVATNTVPQRILARTC